MTSMLMSKSLASDGSFPSGSLQGAPIDHAGVHQKVPRAVHHARLLEQDSARSWMGAQDESQQGSRPTSDVDDRRGGRKVIGVEDRCGFLLGVRRHAAVEARCGFRMTLQVIKERGAVSALEGGEPGHDAVKGLAIRAPHPLVAMEHRERSDGSGRVTAQQVSGRSELESPVGHFSEHAEAGQRAQQPVQGARVRADRGRQG